MGFLMKHEGDRDKEAILRMMIYLRHELVRNSCDLEAQLLAKAISSFQIRLGKDDE